MELSIPNGYKPTESDKACAEQAQEVARLLAKTHLPVVLTQLVETSLAPQATHKQVMDAADYLYRVSGLSAKQEAKQSTGATIVFNLSGGKRLTVSEKTINDTPADLEAAILDVVPTYVTTLAADDDLTLGDLDDE